MIKKLIIFLILILFHLNYYTLNKKQFVVKYGIFELLKTNNISSINGSKLFINNNFDGINFVKKNLLNFISKSVGKAIDSVKYIYLGKNMRFGNQLIRLYNTMFMCEILGCKKIFLEKKDNWYLNNKINNKKYKISIESKDLKNLDKLNIIIDKSHNMFYFSKIIEPIMRVNILRKEIFRNLRIIKVNYNDLFIYIRSGDIFAGSHPHTKYIQPPLCFYKNVLDNYKYKKIFIISENKNNPVIDKILEKYPNIVYNINPLKIDIGYLLNAYNLVGGSTSTFLRQIILLNNNIKIIWDFIFEKRSKLDIIFSIFRI
jgi:hypothetical protein